MFDTLIRGLEARGIRSASPSPIMARSAYDATPITLFRRTRCFAVSRIDGESATIYQVWEGDVGFDVHTMVFDRGSMSPTDSGILTHLSEEVTTTYILGGFASNLVD